MKYKDNKSKINVIGKFVQQRESTKPICLLNKE